MLPFILCMLFFASGILLGAFLFRTHSQEWADTWFLRDRIDHYRRKLQTADEDRTRLAQERERAYIRAEVLEEALESEAETYFLLTGKRADDPVLRKIRVSMATEKRLVEAEVAAAVIKDVTAVEMGHSPEAWKTLLTRDKHS